MGGIPFVLLHYGTSEVLKHYKEVHLDIDVMYINKIPFLVAVSKSIGMIHCIPVMNKDNKRVSDALTSNVAQYNGKGFKVATMHGDGAFESLKDWAMNTHQVQVTMCGTDGHVPQAENAIKFIKNKYVVYSVIYLLNNCHAQSLLKWHQGLLH